MTGTDRKADRQIVLLYNDRERRRVEGIYDLLASRLEPYGLRPWMASMDMLACKSLFDNIEDAIQIAVGAVLFISPLGLGQFQKTIEKSAVYTEMWQRDAQYGRLLVHLGPGVELPRFLLSWPTVNHQGDMSEDAQIADDIVKRFGLSGAV